MATAETLYEPHRQLLDLLQTIGVGNKVRRAGLHSTPKMRPSERVIKGANADTDNSVNGYRVINRTLLTLEAASLQWMEGEKEFSMKTSRSLTTFATCMELPGLPVARDN